MDPTQIAYEIGSYVRVYKDGSFDRYQNPIFLPPSLDPLTGVSSKDALYSPERNLSARLYLPQTTPPHHKLPLLLYIHGGRFCIESPSSPLYHPFLNSLVSKANAVAVSVDYRLAPEHPLPAAYDDAWAALQWVGSHSNGHGPEEWLNRHADFERVYIAGDSAGANITHNMLIRAGQEPTGMGFHGAVLIHPYFWGEEAIGSEATHPFKPIMDRAWAFACPSSPSNDDPRINPFVDGAPELAGLGCARVLVCVAEKDIFRDRGWLYYKKLKENGWKGEVEIVETHGEDHVFHIFNPNKEKAIELVNSLASFIKK